MKKNIDQIVDDILQSEPDFQLRRDFSDRVIQRLRKMEVANQRKFFFWISLGTLAIFGFGVAVFAFFVPAEWIASLRMNGMDQVIPLAVVIGVVVGIIQYLDKKLVKDKMLRLH